MYRSVIDETPNIDDNDKNFQCSRPSIIIKRKRKIYEKTFASKWANFKLFLNHPSGVRSRILCVKGTGPSPIRRWDVNATFFRFR